MYIIFVDNFYIILIIRLCKLFSIEYLQYYSCIYEMSNLSINLKKTIILRIKLSFKFLKDACRLMAQIHKLYSRGKLNKSYSSESNPVTAYNSVTVRDWTGNCKWITPEACTWTHISKTVLKIYVKKKKKQTRKKII